ncbi:MAG: amino acid ABC transporter substrate-binding protein [Chloroflexi bacterium]|nr:amino acid ABC transporter substrate-binding protein [Chloroflexota bacterium]
MPFNRLSVTSRVIAACSLLAAACNVSTPPAQPGGAAPAPPPTSAAVAPAPTTGAPAAAAASTGPIVVGVSQALTGDKSDGGTAIENGYKVWIKEVNDSGGLLGRQVQLKDYDNNSLADTSVSQYERLITVDKVDLLLGPVSSALTIPDGPVAEKYHMVMSEGAGGAPPVFERNLHYLFFVQPGTAEHQADPFTDYILSLPADQRPKTAAYPSFDDPFATAVVDQARKALEGAGIQTVYTQIYPPTQTDFGPIAQQVKQSGADIVFCGSAGTSDVTAFVQAMVSINYQPKATFFSAGPDEGTNFLEALGERTEGIFNAAGWVQDAKTPGNGKFVQEYLEMFANKDNLVPPEAAEGYSAAQVLEAAVRGTNSLDNAKMADWLHGNKVQTVQGMIGWDAAGRPQGTFTLLQWQKGKFVAVWPKDDPSKSADPVYPKPNW